MMPFAKTLLRWYDAHRRDLPWRRTQNPYHILTSEIMLQQTQVKTVIPYYERWLARFPTFQALAKASVEQVLKSWEGLGYYSRARNFHALAGAVIDRHDGTLPHTFEALKALPGIGRYTAGAVLSIAFGKKFPVLDGNVMRVLTRYFANTHNISLPETQKELWKVAEHLLPETRVGDYNQALMELGATICTPKVPLCPECPLNSTCHAHRLHREHEIPVKSKSGAVPHLQIGAGVIWRGRQILISQRPLKGLLGGLWEFPGGKQEKGEKMEDTVRREIREELNVRVRVGRELIAVDHAYSHFKITLHVHECRYISGTVKALGVRAWRWVLPGELKRFAFPAANQPVIRLLTERVRSARADARSPSRAKPPSTTRKSLRTRARPSRG